MYSLKQNIESIIDENVETELECPFDIYDYIDVYSNEEQEIDDLVDITEPGDIKFEISDIVDSKSAADEIATFVMVQFQDIIDSMMNKKLDNPNVTFLDAIKIVKNKIDEINY